MMMVPFKEQLRNIIPYLPNLLITFLNAYFYILMAENLAEPLEIITVN